MLLVPPARLGHPQVLRAVAPLEVLGSVTSAGLDGELNEREAWHSSVLERSRPRCETWKDTVCISFGDTSLFTFHRFINQLEAMQNIEAKLFLLMFSPDYFPEHPLPPSWCVNTIVSRIRLPLPPLTQPLLQGGTQTMYHILTSGIGSLWRRIIQEVFGLVDDGDGFAGQS